MTTRAPRTQYAKSGEVNIAYQVVGDGRRDLVYVPGWVSNVELMWDDSVLAGATPRDDLAQVAPTLHHHTLRPFSHVVNAEAHRRSVSISGLAT